MSGWHAILHINNFKQLFWQLSCIIIIHAGFIRHIWSLPHHTTLVVTNFPLYMHWTKTGWKIQLVTSFGQTCWSTSYLVPETTSHHCLFVGTCLKSHKLNLGLIQQTSKDVIRQWPIISLWAFVRIWNGVAIIKCNNTHGYRPVYKWCPFRNPKYHQE